MLAHEAESQIIYEADWSYKQIKSVYMHVWICLCVTELLKTNKKAASKKKGPVWAIWDSFSRISQHFKHYPDAVRFNPPQSNKYETLCCMIYSELTYPEACVCLVCNLLINSFSTSPSHRLSQSLWQRRGNNSDKTGLLNPGTSERRLRQTKYKLEQRLANHSRGLLKEQVF